ncbi:cupin domain-containing protein [Roseiarcaceae bacterium H3SJ34-1]|uniref:cupin domain-containing protein n=1 Tax=Terripilifer ovatus TaxID=3032367 RepID=UPI003AB91DB7|nr:cupin domain-containing protein [Roseiarcaceae bacterium H3SJ34-1]
MAEFGKHLQELNPIPEPLRRKWQQNDMVPLWETENDIFAPPREQPRHWPWSVMRPILVETSEITDPAIIERRVLQLVNPTAEIAGGDATAGLMNAALQALRAGESARPHRHSINALRFILEGNGAQTIVNGRPCRMTPGDLVLTPAWAWHEHRHDGGAVSIWLDVLDGNLHRILGQAIFQPGPAIDLEPAGDEPSSACATIEPVHHGKAPDVFRYPWNDAERVLNAAPAGPDGVRKARYINPATRGACLPLIDCWLQQIDAGGQSVAASSPADTVVSVVEGEGVSRIGDREIQWSAKDTFTIPRRTVASHMASKMSRLFFASNVEVYRRLGLAEQGTGTQQPGA